MGDAELEGLWERLLSRQPEEVRMAFRSLSVREQEAVLAHLRRMVVETGWHPAQRTSAQAALDALNR